MEKNISKGIKKYDDRGNLIYWKHFGDYIYEEWRKYDENNRKIYCNENGNEFWFKYDKRGRKWIITEKEFKEIEFRKKEKEYLSRTKCSRFEIMDI